MPTENRSSNTEMVILPRELSDDLAELIATRARVCGGGAFEIWEAICEGFAAPAPQPHPEPIAWMVGTAFWWTKEEAERDAEATGLPIVGLGPMAGIAPAEQHQGEPVAWRGLNDLGEVVTEWIDGVPPEDMVNLCGTPASFAKIEQAYTHADPGEVERLCGALAELKASYAEQEAQVAEDFKCIDDLRAQLAEAQALLRSRESMLSKVAQGWILRIGTKENPIPLDDYQEGMAYTMEDGSLLAALNPSSAEPINPSPKSVLSAEQDKLGNVTAGMLRAAQLNSELGAYATANLSGAYDLIGELYEVMYAARHSTPVTADSVEKLKSAAEAAIAEMKVTGQRWPQDDDWFEPELCSAEMEYVKAVSPFRILSLLAKIDEQADLIRRAEQGLRKTVGFYANSDQCCSEHMQLVIDLAKANEQSNGAEPSTPVTLCASELGFHAETGTCDARAMIARIKDLGITYFRLMPDRFGDCLWFFNCRNVPAVLPEWLEVKSSTAKDWVGHGGITEEIAKEIETDAGKYRESAPVEIDERAEFERAAAEQGSNIDRNSEGDYVNTWVQSEWEGWQARAALERKP